MGSETHTQNGDRQPSFLLSSGRKEQNIYHVRASGTLRASWFYTLKKHVLPTAHLFDFCGSKNKQLFFPRAALGDLKKKKKLRTTVFTAQYEPNL
jgi:hypothetical protein